MTTRNTPSSDLDDAYDSIETYPLNMHKELNPEVLKKLEWKHDGAMEYLFYIDTENGAQHKAVFVLIARIQDSETSFKFVPDGDWQGPGGSTFASDFKTARLSCVLEKPAVTDRPNGFPLAATWQAVNKNFDVIQQKKRTPESHEPQTFFVGVKTAIKVSHKLFKLPPRKSKDSSSGVADNATDNPNAVDCSLHASLKMENWPFSVDGRAANAVKNLPEGTVLVPLPAYTYEPETVILPEDYQAKLKGALVLCHVTLAHFYKKSDKKDVFVAEIARVDFLGPRIVAPFMSPTKKRRLNNPNAGS